MFNYFLFCTSKIKKFFVHTKVKNILEKKYSREKMIKQINKLKFDGS